MDSNDYKHLAFRVTLIAADALTPEQLDRKRSGENALAPLSDEAIENILTMWRERLRDEIPKSAGYFVLAYSS